MAEIMRFRRHFAGVGRIRKYGNGDRRWQRQHLIFRFSGRQPKSSIILESLWLGKTGDATTSVLVTA